MPGMDTPPQPLNPILLLPRDTCYQLVHTLRGMLPPPVTDTPEDLTRRDNAAIAHVACLMPVNADEADLATQYVATNACAMDCLRLAQEHRGDAKLFLRFSARATTMMRQARATRTLLLRVQAERRNLEADSAAADHAARTEHCAIGQMTDALGGVQPAAMAEPPRPPPPAPQPQAKEPATDPTAQAEQYAAIYPQLAERIPTLDSLSGTVLAGLNNKPGHDGASAVISSNGESYQTTPDRLADRDTRRQ
jgi:hypothetical protein